MKNWNLECFLLFNLLFLHSGEALEFICPQRHQANTQSQDIVITGLFTAVHVRTLICNDRMIQRGPCLWPTCCITYSDLHSFSFWAQGDVCETPLSTHDTAGPSFRHHGSLQRQCISGERNKKRCVYDQAMLKTAQLQNVRNLMRLFDLSRGDWICIILTVTDLKIINIDKKCLR